MNATPRTTKAERAGRWLGRAWRGLARQEARAIQWLAGKGLPAGVARLLFWIVKLVVFGVLLVVVRLALPDRRGEALAARSISA